MSLSIYTIKHPLVISWANCLSQEEITTFEEFDLIQKIVLALVYEATRKFLHIHQLYLQKLTYLEKISILDNKFSYCIITDIYFSQITGKKILSLLPQSQIWHLPLTDDNIKNLYNQYREIKSGIKIIIVQELLNIEIIVETMELLLDWNISEQDLRICCMSCSSKTLTTISSKHPNLSIYTINIVDN